MKAVEKPNLPVQADRIIIGEKYSSLLRKPLENLGIHPLFMPDNKLVDPRLSGHADLSVLHGGGNRLWLAPHLMGSRFAVQLREMGFVLDDPGILQSSVYPGDAQLNVCICGQYALYNPCNIPKSIAEFLTISSHHIVPCRQGYTKCSICVVDEGAIITEDRGVEAAARRAGLEVLRIEPGFVTLEGFLHGFIGGAAFKISTGKLAFTGTLNGSRLKDDILNFLEKRQIEPIYLTDRPVFDIGSGLPVTEK